MRPFVTTPYRERRLTAVNTTSAKQYEWYTPWQIGPGVDNVSIVLKTKNIVSAPSTVFTWRPCLQVALVRTDNPSTITELGTAQTGENEYPTGKISVSTQTNAAMWFRLGVVYYMSASGTGSADVGFQASWLQLAEP